MPITLDQFAQRGLTIADAARLSGVAYHRVWKMATGGLSRGLEPEEERRLQRLLAETLPDAA